MEPLERFASQILAIGSAATGQLEIVAVSVSSDDVSRVSNARKN